MKFPFKKGDWVCDGHQLAKVLDVHPRDGAIDLVLYAEDGTKIGRQSEAYDGPKGFEPFCGAEHWYRIELPDFPIKRGPHTLEELVVKKPLPKICRRSAS